MGSSGSGIWIFGGVIYYVIAFVLCFSVVSLAIEYPQIDTSNIKVISNNVGLDNVCVGSTYPDCSALSVQENISGSDCYDYGNCISLESGGSSGLWNFIVTLGGVAVETNNSVCMGSLGECDNYSGNETLCEMVGCVYGEESVEYFEKMRQLQSDSTSLSKGFSAIKQTISLMFGFNGTVEGQGNFSIILFLLLTLLPSSMIIFGVYTALRG